MTVQQAALDHLRVIRSLMEKSHHYRAVSAPAALAGGLLAGVAAAWQLAHWQPGAYSHEPLNFIWPWLAVLIVSSALNTWMLARDASQRGEPAFSERMRTALRAIIPPLLSGAVLGIGLIVYLENLTMAALTWVVCYGLALLATANFAPRSLVRLGWAFVVSGLALFLAWAGNAEIRMLPSDEGPAAAVMGVTFGLLHLIYAAALLIARKPEVNPTADD